jgi:hypothetical protein
MVQRTLTLSTVVTVRLQLTKGRHDTQHNDIQNNDAQNNNKTTKYSA